MARGELALFTCGSGEKFAELLPNEIDKIKFEAATKLLQESSNFIGNIILPQKTKLDKIKTTRFADGEIKTELESSVRGKDVFLVQSLIGSENRVASCYLEYDCGMHTRLIETLFAIDAIKGAGGAYVNVVIPYLAYGRQDKRKGRESRSAKVIASLFDAIEPKNIRTTLITMDLHAGQIESFYDNVKVENLKPASILIDYFKKNHKEDLENLVVVSPDAGGAARAEYYAKKLQTENALMSKKRSYVEANLVEAIYLLGSVKDKNVLIVDDMIDTAGSLEKAVYKLKENGALDILAACSHPLFSYPAVDRLGNLYSKGILKEVVGTDSIIYGDSFKEKNKWFKQVSIAPLVAKVIYNINNDLSVSSLFD
ncbi:ribose-phosphate pyrophosphokinase [Candidatus Woesearchaeota archaeon]|nr:ribose-phosphate pyrophosphokinase [Candidatus Woesearchaeota archaeon]